MSEEPFLKPTKSCATCAFFRNVTHPEFKIIVIGDVPRLKTCTLRNKLLADTLKSSYFEESLVVCDEHREGVS